MSVPDRVFVFSVQLFELFGIRFLVLFVDVLVFAVLLGKLFGDFFTDIVGVFEREPDVLIVLLAAFLFLLFLSLHALYGFLLLGFVAEKLHEVDCKYLFVIFQSVVDPFVGIAARVYKYVAG